MINSLPLSLLQAAQTLVETQDVLESCKDCGAVLGTCIHTDNLKEDNLTALDVPDEDAPTDQLSGGKEEVIINPEYKTFTPRRPY